MYCEPPDDEEDAEEGSDEDLFGPLATKKQ
jgi:hypothetical protein